MKVPKSHPRRKSLEEHERIARYFRNGIVAPAGMMAHGRGEAFDYLIGERTTEEAKRQAMAAAALLLTAKRPVICVNGNTTALCAKEIAELSRAIPASVEVNLFYRTKKRLGLIEAEFRKLGIRVLGTKKTARVPGLVSKRQFVDPDGVFAADAALVMLEDGDRTEFLRKMGKKVIAIDLNPLSRTARNADIAIVDNVTRAVPLLAKFVRKLRKKKRKTLMNIVKKFDNIKSLEESESRIRGGAGRWKRG
ncbi:MAG: phosphopantothenate/pantothenate synthetase [Candidatus Diapherotrites archaeon]|uniref:Phosphopantothenate/pantothenate synthetase n=1 Tax=Candidatus Iainarchaeum sp. TaxID=3101447 RepID=A0A8T3YJE3_9ARCH|nr:phosphopantothenate/pantothenate synthetase [Candidatus Diapherotrites archaeon]